MHTCFKWSVVFVLHWSVDVHVVLFFLGSITFGVDTLWAQLLLESSTDHFLSPNVSQRGPFEKGLSVRPRIRSSVDTMRWVASLRKHAYSNTLKILPPKNSNFSDKKI